MIKKDTSKKKTKAAGKAAGKKSKFDKKAAIDRVKKILPVLKKLYPNAKTALNYNNPLELLIATILSAQCTDKRVNMVTKELFRKYKSASDWAKADIKQIEEDIKTTGFYRSKAKSIRRACTVIADKFNNKIPDDINELTELPGVGRKTANVILGNAFSKPAITCDTHVIRLSRRLGLSENKNAVKLEFDLAEIVPKKDWTLFSHLLIFHGRNVCKARKPQCQICQAAEYCPSANNPNLW